MKLSVMALALMVAASGNGATVPKVKLTLIGEPSGLSEADIRLHASKSVANLNAFGGNVVNVRNFVAPSSVSPNYSAVLLKAESWMETDIQPSGNWINDPTVPGFPTNLVWWHITESRTRPLWMGKLDTTNSDARERGHITPFGVEVKVEQGVALANLRVMISSSDSYEGHPMGSLAVTQRMSAINYSARAAGIKADGTRITSGPPTQVARIIEFTGFAIGYIGDTQGELDNIMAYVFEQTTPLTITARWDVLGANDVPIVTGVKQWSVAPSQSAQPHLVIVRGQNQVQITVHGVPRVSHTVEFSADLINWFPLATVYNEVTGVSVITVPREQRMRFFRTSTPY